MSLENDLKEMAIANTKEAMDVLYFKTMLKEQIGEIIDDFFNDASKIVNVVNHLKTIPKDALIRDTISPYKTAILTLPDTPAGTNKDDLPAYYVGKVEEEIAKVQ